MYHDYFLLFCQQRSPLGKACTFGRLEVVNLLLERGAEVKPRALEDALKEGYEYVSCVGVPYSKQIFTGIILGCHASGRVHPTQFLLEKTFSKTTTKFVKLIHIIA